MNPHYTVLVAANNEGHRLELTIRNFLGRAPLVVIDNFSTDDTREVAARLGVPVIQHKNPGFADAENYRVMLGAVKTEWFWLIYCGHHYPLTLIEACERAMESGRYDAVALEGFPVQYGVRTSVYGLNRHRRMETTRLARKTHIDLSRYRIHAELPYAGSDERVWYPPLDEAHLIQNYREDDLAMMNRKTETYSCEEARQRFERGERASGFTLLVRPALDLAKRLLWRRGLFEGWRGILTAVAQSYQRFCVEARLLELAHHGGRDQQRIVNAQVRDRLLSASGR